MTRAASRLSLAIAALAAAASGCGQINGDAVSRGAQTLTYLYVGNYGESTISTYQFLGGTLTQAAGTIATAEGTANISSLLVSKTGTHLYASEHSSANISLFTISQSTAPYPALPVPIATPAPIDAGAGVSQVVADPSFAHAYAVDSNVSGANINEYSIDPASGTLTSIGFASGGVTPVSLVVDPSGTYLYVLNGGSANISGFTIGSDGTLTAMASPFAVGQSSPTHIVTDPAGKFVYVTCAGSDTVAVFSLGAGGALSAATPATAATGSSPNSIAIASSGKFAFVVNKSGNSVSAYGVNSSTGALTPVAGSPFALTSGSAAPYALAVDPSGHYLVTANQSSGDVTVFSIDATSGALKTVGTPVQTGLSPQSVAFVSLIQSL